ncbi:IS66 family insertion sequence element accessory protein TnpA [Sansalvadorimonas verongulae]|uniref:IS66 family insertion sequence element accessory protein TnpA n=1 Tax=Sansalvadorimonas verongulae TaxID=2172824 RepID=UPI0012BCD8BB|nr:hypothetical protein [Sansalvadorimonas verongulae]MTI12842.1 hypothetical protein [Sansalvadorimonas verongulae]
MSSKRDFWFRHIEAWHKSRLAQVEYARKHDLSIKSFGYYRRRYFQELENPSPQPSKTNLLPVTILPEEKREAGATTTETNNPGITVTSPGGFRIELTAGFDPQALKQVLKILEVA